MSAIMFLLAFALGADADRPAWSARVLLEAPRSLGGAAIGDLDPQSPGNEVTAVSANGDVWLVRRAGDDWTPERIHTSSGELIMGAIGDADPRYPGNEFVGVGMVAGEESLSGPGQALMLRRTDAGWEAERLFVDEHMLHGVAIGDVAARYPGNEVVVCGFSHRVTLLHQEGHGYAAEVIYVGNNRQKVLTIADVIPEHDGNEIVVCGTDGNVVAIYESGLGWRHEVVFSDRAGQSRVATGNFGVLIGGDNGVVTLAQRVEQGWANTFLTREAGKMRGTAIADVDEHIDGEELYACGYARRVIQLSRNEEDYWVTREIYADAKPLHHLVAGELDADHPGAELVTCGHGGRLVLLTPVP